MTRKDYIAIAAAIKRNLDAYGDYTEARQAMTEIAISVSQVMARDNARFDSIKFLAACGV